MNTEPGIIGIKIGMTQLFRDDGTIVTCTVVDAACRVVGVRTQEKDGYSALILGIGQKKDKRTSKAVRTAYAKKGQTVPRITKEVRAPADYVAKFELGQELKVEEIFEEGQFVDVQAKSKGRGFSGVMRRYNFRGAKATHGAHEAYRHGGSIGTTTTPGRVMPGKKMPGQHGNKIVSVLNQKVAKVYADKRLVLIEGTVPGASDSFVRVQRSVKKTKRRGGGGQ